MKKQNLDPFVECIYCSILEVKITVEDKFIDPTPAGFRVYGGKAHSEEVGQKYQTVIDIKGGLEGSLTHISGIKKLIFNGLCPLEKGDSIRAYILKAKTEKKYVESTGVHDGARLEYIARDFNETESVFKIEKVNDWPGTLPKVLATYLDMKAYREIYLTR